VFSKKEIGRLKVPGRFRIPNVSGYLKIRGTIIVYQLIAHASGLGIGFIFSLPVFVTIATHPAIYRSVGLVDEPAPFVLPDIKKSVAPLRKGVPPRTHFFTGGGHLMLESFTGAVNRRGNKFPHADLGDGILGTKKAAGSGLHS
jgi:hypothetical protein